MKLLRLFKLKFKDINLIEGIEKCLKRKMSHFKKNK